MGLFLDDNETPPLDMEAAKKSLAKAGMSKVDPLLEAGNIDLENRPHVRNADGSISTVRSVGVEIDGEEILIPTVSDDGKILSVEEAVKQYERTGKHLGKYKDAASANKAAEGIHNDQAKKIETAKSFSFLEDVPEPESSPGTAFAKGAVHGATAGWMGEFEPDTTQEKIANTAGELVGFGASAMALSPLGRAAVAGTRLAKSAAAAETIAGAVWGAARKPEEGESRMGNIVKDAALFGIGGAAFDVAKKLLKEATPYTTKVLKLAEELKIAPEAAEIIVKRTGKGEDLVKVYDEIVGPSKYGENAAYLEATPPNQPGGNEATKEAFKKGLPRTPAEAEKQLSYADYEIPNISGPPAVVKERAPYATTPADFAQEIGQAATRVASPEIPLGITRPRPGAGSPALPRSPFEISPETYTGKRPEYSQSTPRMYTLYKSGFINPQSELTPEGARHVGLFNFLKPRSMDEKVKAVMEKPISSFDDNFHNVPPPLQKFIKNEVEGAAGSVQDSFAKGASFAEALDRGLQSFARQKKLIANPENLRAVFEEVMARSQLAAGRVKEILPKLNADTPAADLAKQAQIPEQDAGAILNELAAHMREPYEILSTYPRPNRSVPAARNIMSDEVISPEVLDRGLAATEITPEQFRNAGYIRPDGSLTDQGRDLLNTLNPEWKIPLTERVLDKPPKPARIGSGGRKYEAFDVNSPEGRAGLASVRSGGKSNIPLSKGTIEGFLPMSVEDGLARRAPLVRKVPGGYQFTEKGAALAATRPGGVVNEIDVAANRQFIRNVDPTTGQVTFSGGRGGKSFQGMDEAAVKRANLEYEVEKTIVKEYRGNAASWKGCPED